MHENKSIYTQDLHSKLQEMIDQNEMEKKAIEQRIGEDGEVRDEGETKRLIDEAVFLQSYIPTSLNEFLNPVAGNIDIYTIYVYMISTLCVNVNDCRDAAYRKWR